MDHRTSKDVQGPLGDCTIVMDAEGKGVRAGPDGKGGPGGGGKFAPDADGAEAARGRGPPPTSIYDLYTARQRWTILAAISFAAILAPFSDTIYLPALTVVAHSLNTTVQLATTSVSIYMYMVGGAVLIWGPLCDRYGRRPIYLSSTAMFVAASVVCAFAPSIEVLIAFRALQGAAVTTLSTCGPSVIADIFPPATRGFASGIMVVPMMLGPILGPVLGGGFSQALGWRSTFVALVIYGAAVLAALVFLLPETHQWYVLKRLEKQDPAGPPLLEAPAIHKPAFPSPLTPLLIVARRGIFPHILSLVVAFSFLFATVTVMPVAFAREPFHLSQAAIGAAYLPGGLGSLAAAPLAGWVSDRLSRAAGGGASVRLLPSAAGSGLVIPAALLGYGFALASGSLVGALACSFFMGIGVSLAMPGTFSWLTIRMQRAAAAAMAGANCVLNLGAGSFIQAGVPGTERLGYAKFFAICACIQFTVAAFSATVACFQVRAEGAKLKAIASAAAAAPAAAAAEGESGGGGGGDGGGSAAGGDGGEDAPARGGR